MSNGLGNCRIVTSEMVLVEFVNALSGLALRIKAAEVVSRLVNDPNVEVIPQTSMQFSSAIQYLKQRPDKEWGLTDCASFEIMSHRKLDEALTHDRHFEQAGFKALMR